MTIKIYNGQLKIDHDNGTVDFERDNIRLLRVTHMPDPIPDNVSIDMVALPALTSYTTIKEQWRDAPQGSNKTSNTQLETKRNA